MLYAVFDIHSKLNEMWKWNEWNYMHTYIHIWKLKEKRKKRIIIRMKKEMNGNKKNYSKYINHKILLLKIQFFWIIVVFFYDGIVFIPFLHNHNHHHHPHPSLDVVIWYVPHVYFFHWKLLFEIKMGNVNKGMKEINDHVLSFIHLLGQEDTSCKGNSV